MFTEVREGVETENSKINITNYIKIGTQIWLISAKFSWEERVGTLGYYKKRKLD